MRYWCTEGRIRTELKLKFATEQATKAQRGVEV
jgi:hypothetical protein